MMTNEAETVATSATLTNFLPVHHPPPSALFCPPLLSFLRISQGGRGSSEIAKGGRRIPQNQHAQSAAGSTHRTSGSIPPPNTHITPRRDPWRNVHLMFFCKVWRVNRIIITITNNTIQCMVEWGASRHPRLSPWCSSSTPYPLSARHPRRRSPIQTRMWPSRSALSRWTVGRWPTLISPWPARTLSPHPARSGPRSFTSCWVYRPTRAGGRPRVRNIWSRRAI